MTTIAQNLASVRARIDQACAAAQRDPSSVRLIAVSKTKPAAMIREAYAAGQRDFGENYAQELAAKAQELADLHDIRWHFIGPLQRNKAAIVVSAGATLHTVDRTKLVNRMQQLAAQAQMVLPVLIQLNLSGEETKSGIAASALAEMAQHIGMCDALTCAGLMTMPPPDVTSEVTAGYFSQLAALREVLAETLDKPASTFELSMGMTSDLEIAVRCGATMVRVGTAIFGAR